MTDYTVKQSDKLTEYLHFNEYNVQIFEENKKCEEHIIQIGNIEEINTVMDSNNDNVFRGVTLKDYVEYRRNSINNKVPYQKLECIIVDDVEHRAFRFRSVGEEKYTYKPRISSLSTEYNDDNCRILISKEWVNLSDEAEIYFNTDMLMPEILWENLDDKSKNQYSHLFNNGIKVADENFIKSLDVDQKLSLLWLMDKLLRYLPCYTYTIIDQYSISICGQNSYYTQSNHSIDKNTLISNIGLDYMADDDILNEDILFEHEGDILKGDNFIKFPNGMFKFVDTCIKSLDNAKNQREEFILKLSFEIASYYKALDVKFMYDSFYILNPTRNYFGNSICNLIKTRMEIDGVVFEYNLNCGAMYIESCYEKYIDNRYGNNCVLKKVDYESILMDILKYNKDAVDEIKKYAELEAELKQNLEKNTQEITSNEKIIPLSETLKYIEEQPVNYYEEFINFVKKTLSVTHHVFSNQVKVNMYNNDICSHDLTSYRGNSFSDILSYIFRVEAIEVSNDAIAIFNNIDSNLTVTSYKTDKEIVYRFQGLVHPINYIIFNSAKKYQDYFNQQPAEYQHMLSLEQQFDNVEYVSVNQENNTVDGKNLFDIAKYESHINNIEAILESRIQDAIDNIGKTGNVITLYDLPKPNYKALMNIMNRLSEQGIMYNIIGDDKYLELI